MPGFLSPAVAGTVGGPYRGVVSPPHHVPKAKCVIFLCMAGGPSHLETFDAKPKLAELDGATVTSLSRTGRRWRLASPVEARADAAEQAAEAAARRVRLHPQRHARVAQPQRERERRRDAAFEMKMQLGLGLRPNPRFRHRVGVDHA